MSEEGLTNDETGEADVEQASVEDIETLQQALAEQKKGAEKYLANWQRAQADLANYKKHVGQEKQEILDFGNSTLILSLLPVVDDFERAFKSLPSELAEVNWIEGIKIIYNNLKAALKKAGVTEIEAKGERFDPHLHEATMSQVGEEGVVLEEIQKGYRLKDRVLRPSLVVVGRGKEEIEEESHGESSRD